MATIIRCGGGGGADVSGVTASSQDVVSGKVIVDVNGNTITGTRALQTKQIQNVLTASSSSVLLSPTIPDLTISKPITSYSDYGGLATVSTSSFFNIPAVTIDGGTKSAASGTVRLRFSAAFNNITGTFASASDAFSISVTVYDADYTRVYPFTTIYSGFITSPWSWGPYYFDQVLSLNSRSGGQNLLIQFNLYAGSEYMTVTGGTVSFSNVQVLATQTSATKYAIDESVWNSWSS